MEPHSESPLENRHVGFSQYGWWNMHRTRRACHLLYFLRASLDCIYMLPFQQYRYSSELNWHRYENSNNVVFSICIHEKTWFNKDQWQMRKHLILLWLPPMCILKGNQCCVHATGLVYSIPLQHLIPFPHSPAALFALCKLQSLHSAVDSLHFPMWPLWANQQRPGLSQG